MPRVKARGAGRRSRQELMEIKKERKIAENLEAILQKNFEDRLKSGEFAKKFASKKYVFSNIKMDDTDYRNDIEVYETLPKNTAFKIKNSAKSAKTISLCQNCSAMYPRSVFLKTSNSKY